MADRSVVVRLRAEVASYVAGLKTATKATTDLGTEIAQQGRKSSADIQRIGTVSVIAGVGIAAAFGKAAFTAADFEKQMSGVRAVSGASASEMDRLSDAALAAGASTKLAGVTASDAARAEAELVKAGVSVSDVLGGALMGSLTLAAAGQLDFADAATIAAQAMNIFDLDGRDVTHVADLLAAAANKSAADVAGLGDSLRQGGLVAAQTGLSIEETTAGLAAFADNALIGSDAGTALKTMLQRLTPQSVEAAELMKELGFAAYDSKGNFIGLEALAGELQSSLSGLTDEQRNSAMATLFGSDAVRGANILYEEGAAGIADYVEAVNDEGAAARMAAIQNDNLKGDIEALGGALETALIQNGSKATGALRAITQGATDLVGGFSQMPDTLQSVYVGLGGITGAAALVGGGFVTLAPKITAAKDSLTAMDSSVANFAGRNLGKFSAGLAGVGAALTAGVIIYGQATKASQEYEAEVSDLALAFDPVTEGQATLNEEVKNFLKLQQEGLSTDAIAALREFDVSLRDVQTAIEGGNDALDPLRETVRELGVDLDGVDLGQLDDAGFETQLQTLADAMGVPADALKELIDELEDWDNEAQDAAQRAIETAVANDTFSQSAVDAAIEANTLSDGTINYAGALRDLAPPLADTEEGVGGVGASMEDAADAAETLKEQIEKLMEPLDTQAALDQFNSGINDMTERFKDADEAVADARENLDDRKDALADLLAIPKADRGKNWDEQVEDARDAIVEAEADIQEAIEATSRSLEGNSEAAIENRDMIDQLTRDAAAALQQLAEDESLTAEERLFSRNLLIGSLEAELEALGFSKEAIEKYIGVLEAIPQEVGTEVTVNLKVATAGEVVAVNKVRAVAQGGLIYADQGVFVPRGTDTVPAMLTPGEFVMRKAAVDRFGVGFMDALNRGQLTAASGLGAASYDQSRHNNWQPVFHIAAKSPQDAAGAVHFRLRRIAMKVGA